MNSPSGRIPPCLHYLTIYNPTLVPLNADNEDEDAEEQAHIVFYTSRERAVSRDRMLRQIGLAKALVNFSQMFNSEEPCENVHSQSKRMFMISPEPDFWIHAGIEIAKTARPPPPTDRKSKGKELAPVVYDYHDASIDDLAVHKYIQRGYEKFKLAHGSFTSILSRLGQQALELQLERFFTVWAWSWNFDELGDFGGQLGIPLHPLHQSIKPLLEIFSQQLPDEVVALLVSPPYAIPSSRFIAKSYPTALSTHIISLVSAHAPTPPAVTVTAAEESSEASQNSDSKTSSIPGAGLLNGTRKWNWPGYLTFGKGVTKKPPLEQIVKREQQENEPATIQRTVGSVETGVDTLSLEEAISDNASIISRGATPFNELPEMNFAEPKEEDVEGASHEEADPPLAFQHSKVYLNLVEQETDTRLCQVSYMVKWPLAVTLIGTDELDTAAKSSLADLTQTMVSDLSGILKEDTIKSAMEIPSAAKILQPRDRQIISDSNFTSSTGFTSTSEHFFNAQLLQASDPGILEVFSRGQNPQHWHVARSGVTPSEIDSGRIYLEVGRKEASLTDVDNLLAGAIKRQNA